MAHELRGGRAQALRRFKQLSDAGGRQLKLAGVLWWLFCASLAPLPAAAAATNAPAAFNVEAATRAYLDQLTPAQKARSDAYFEGGYWLQLWDFLWGTAVLLLLLESGGSRRLRDLAARWTRFPSLQTAIYALGFVLALTVLTFPLTLYESYYREKQYGMANQTLGGWLGDQVTSLMVSEIAGAVALVLLFAIVRRLRRTWHIWGAVTALGLFMLLAALGPVYIAPLFNKYTVLSDPKVLQPILRLARANGIPADKVYVMDASRQTKRISANVSGLLGTTRITLNDNLLNRSSLPEIEAIMGHEMGHYVMHHIYKDILFMGVIIVLGFALLRAVLDWSLARRGGRWGITDIGDPAVLPLAMLLFSTYLFLLTPVLNTSTRTQEMEADRFGLNAARQPDGFARAALKLSEYRKMEPTPFEEWFFYDHPSGATRIRTAMQWKAENLGTADALP